MIDRELLYYVADRIRPQLQGDGGDMEIVDIDDDKGTVYVKLTGACSGCPMSAITLSQGIERVMKEHVPGVYRVLPDLESLAEEESYGVDVTVVDDDGNIVEQKTVSPEEFLDNQQ